MESNHRKGHAGRGRGVGRYFSTLMLSIASQSIYTSAEFFSTETTSVSLL